jgi:excisionase family DNA binding protein
LITPIDKYPDLIKSDEMASYLRISRSTLYRLVRTGRLPAIRVGGCLRFRREAVSQLLSGGSDLSQHRVTVANGDGGEEGTVRNMFPGPENGGGRRWKSLSETCTGANADFSPAPNSDR